MFSKYYQQELFNLKELTSEFSEAHPAIAPMLTGPSADPDVERILEGVAFLTGLLHQKLDEDLPEISHGLMDVVFPHFLRPLPATSIVAFTPKPGLQDKLTVPAGTSLASIPVEGTRCMFQTCFNTEVHPLQLTSAEYQDRGNRCGRIVLKFTLTKTTLDSWNPERLCFTLGGEYTAAANLFSLLTGFCERIVLSPAGKSEGAICELRPEFLTATGFESQNQMLPYSERSFSGYRILQEYFILPQKFLFLELTGWDRWKFRGKGSSFEVSFDIAASPLPRPVISRDSFVLFATPVINLFRDTMDQIVHDLRTEKVRIRSASKQKEHYQVYSVDHVAGHRQGSAAPREYLPLEVFGAERTKKCTYQVVRSRSPVNDSLEYYLSFAYPSEGPPPEPETLSLRLTFTNGSLPERLQAGDIRDHTDNSPGLLDFRNIIAPTSMVEPPARNQIIWKFLSHLSLNFMRLANAETMKTLLALYIFAEGKNKSQIAANQRRIDGIQEITTEPTDRLVKSVVMRGQKIRAVMRQDHFAGLGDMYMFGSVLDRFLGMYAAMNIFTQFEMTDSISGETFVWEPRLGTRPLI